MRRFGVGLTMVAIAVTLAACGSAARTESAGDRVGRKGSGDPNRPMMTIYRSPTCSCCKEYEAYLTAAGYRVEIVELADMSAKKAELGVPEAAWSCHTSKLGRYVVEGHVPIEVLSKLMNEKPAVMGLALPGMPAGAPGMGTPKEGPLHIVSFDAAGALAHYATA